MLLRDYANEIRISVSGVEVQLQAMEFSSSGEQSEFPSSFSLKKLKVLANEAGVTSLMELMALFQGP